MSKQYNKLTVVGHLGVDPDMHYTPSGKAVTAFNLASNDQYTSSETGEVVQTTTWFRCEVWGRMAEVCNQFLKKGSKVLVEGKLKPDPKTGRPEIWFKQDGSPAADYLLSVKEIYFLDSRGGQSEVPQPPEDEYPF